MRYLIVLLLVAQLAGCSTVLSADERTAMAGKTYVITGASSGLGKGVALELAAMRANVVLAARRTEALDVVAPEATARGGTALVVATDVSRQEDVQRLLDAAVARFGRVDVWINNAAVGAIGVFDTIPPPARCTGPCRKGPAWRMGTASASSGKTGSVNNVNNRE